MGFMDNVEEVLDEVGKAFAEAGQEVGRKVKDTARNVRLKNMLHTCEEVIEHNYREIGKAYYEAHRDDETCEYASMCKAISDAARGAEALREQMNEGTQEA